MVAHAGGGGKKQGGRNHPINKVVNQQMKGLRKKGARRKKGRFIESTPANSTDSDA